MRRSPSPIRAVPAGSKPMNAASIVLVRARIIAPRISYDMYAGARTNELLPQVECAGKVDDEDVVAGKMGHAWVPSGRDAVALPVGAGVCPAVPIDSHHTSAAGD